MEKEKVYKAINTELEFQDRLTADPNRPDMIEDFHLGDALTAIRYNLQKAEEAWYIGAVPHTDAMKYIRKITALGVKMGMKLGMPERKLD